MGALTSKTKEFTYRAWEQKSSIEIDDTEVTLFKIRSEKLKSKRVRLLPINYWISDKKRFSREKSLINNLSLFFQELRYFYLDTPLYETKFIHYATSNIKGYKKILDKLLNKNEKVFKCFAAHKSLSKLHSNKIIICDALLLARNPVLRTPLNSFDKEILNKEIILLTNPRLDSPALNAYLLKHSEEHTFFSFSSFASNIKKCEIPLSDFTLIATLQGYYNLKNKTIITSCLTRLPLPITNHTITLTPIYIPTQAFLQVKKEINTTPFFLLSLKKTKILSKPLVCTAANHNADIALPLNNNLFDHFILKKINHKFMDRLLLLSYLIKPSKKYSLFPIQYLN